MRGSVGFLLDNGGRQLGLNDPPLDYGDAERDVIEDAVARLGWVLIHVAHRVIFVELCPRRVAPLAAWEALYQIREASAECAVLAYAGDDWRRSRYEVFMPVKGALQKMDAFARSAGIRAAASLEHDWRCRQLDPLRLGTSRLDS